MSTINLVWCVINTLAASYCHRCGYPGTGVVEVPRRADTTMSRWRFHHATETAPEFPDLDEFICFRG